MVVTMGFFYYVKLLLLKISSFYSFIAGFLSRSFFNYIGLFLYIIVPNWEAFQSLNVIAVLKSFAVTFARLDVVISEGLLKMTGTDIFSYKFMIGIVTVYAGFYGFFWNYKILRFFGEKLWGEFVPNSLWMMVFAGFYMTVFALQGNFPPQGFVAIKEHVPVILDDLVDFVRYFDFLKVRENFVESTVNETVMNVSNSTG